MLDAVGRFLSGVDAFVSGLRRTIRTTLRRLFDGPLQGVLFAAILAVTGLAILIEAGWRAIDRLVARLEEVAIVLVFAGMTFLTFNEYLQRDLKPLLGTDLGGLWSLTGQTNLALMLMVVVGFVGASLATRQRKHLAVDAIDRVLTPGPARFVKRFTALASALLCLVLAKGSWDFIYTDHTHDRFEGVDVWGWMVAPVNAAVSLMPGEKYGYGCPVGTAADSLACPPDLDPIDRTPEALAAYRASPAFGEAVAAAGVDPADVPACCIPRTPLETQYDWEDAKFDEGLEFTTFPPAFPYVEAGDGFPLWIPMLVLAVAFLTMAIRFAVQAIRPPPRDPSLPVPAPGGRRAADVVLAGLFPGALLAMALALWWGQGAMLLLACVLLAFMGAPLFVAVGVGTVGAWVLVRNGSTISVVSDMFEATKKQELLAIPFFVLAGNLMTRGSIAERLIAFAKALLGRLPGGLGVGGVLACALFAAVSGSSPVTVIAIGTLLFPMLVKAGYGERYSMGMLTTAGGLGIIIPPSVPMIVYAVIVSGAPILDASGAKVGEITLDPIVLFKAGIFPGLFIATALMAYTLYVQWPRPGRSGGVVTDGAPFGSPAYFRDVARSLARGAFSLFLPVLILGGIYGLFTIPGTDIGVRFTVTEAAAISVVYALFVELVIHRELKWRDLPRVCTESAVMMGSLFLIIVLAISLNKFMSFEEIPQAATEWMAARVTTRAGFLLAATIFLLALGCVMDILSAILIVGPLLAPIAAQYGVHPVHFAIVFIVNLELGYLTPPMGINLFVASTVFDRPIVEVIRSVLPFLILMLLCLATIVAVPQLSLLLVE